MLPPAYRAFCLLLVVFSTSCSSLQWDRSRIPAVERAQAAWDQIGREGAQTSLLQAYRQSVHAVVKELGEQDTPVRWRDSMRLKSGWTVRLNAPAPVHQTWSPRLFEKLGVTEKEHKEPEGSLRAGLGLPLDGDCDEEQANKKLKLVYETDRHLPVTAVLEFDKNSSVNKQVTLRLYDPREVRSVKAGNGRKVDLAADFAMPAHEMLAGKSFVRRALGGLFRPERFLGTEGLFVQEPYRPDKIPVIFVHGLASDPHIWEKEIAALMSDPEVGPKVQCWCFMYPTGLAVPLSAARLRAAMNEAQMAFDPDKNDPGMNRIMLVGHSMGGLLSRLQIVDAGDAFWRTWFAVPPEKLPLTPDLVTQLRTALLFKSNPRVKRVVFIATPHGGSKIADGWIGETVSRLIRAPLQVVQLVTSVATLDPKLLNPQRVEMKNLGTGSVKGLSTTHPLLKAMASLPLKAPCDSIIAVKDKRVALLDSSDGVVPYSSSHIKGVESEVTVISGHSCTANPETVKAVTKLVRKHLGLRTGAN